MGAERFRNLGRLRTAMYALFVVLAVSGCKTDNPTDPTVVRVGDHVMTRSELRDKMPARYAPEDSARLADQIITTWVRDRVILELAESNLSDEQKDFERELSEYRNSLLTYAYERAMVRQNLDTAVSREEIESYYETNRGNFKLESIILRLRFVKINEKAPDTDQLKKWFRSDDESDFDELDTYCRTYADNFFLDENTWLHLDDFAKEVRLPVADWRAFLNETTYYEHHSGAHLYLVRFYGFLLPGDAPPMRMVDRRIKELILNKRKIDLVKEMREKAVEEAYAKKQVEWKK